MRLKHLATIKTNLKNADFWLIRKGDIKKVGKPVKSFNKEYIGIKVDATDILYPNYLFVVLTCLHGRGHWLTHSYGTLNLQHIKVEDVKNIELVDQQ